MVNATPDVAIAFPSDAVVLAALRALGTAEAAAWAPLIGAACRANHIDLPGRLSMFLANVVHETGGLRTLGENLNYSVAGLLATFGRHRISEADARRHGRRPGEPALSVERQRAIANLIYGGAWGRQNLGNTQPNDGWFFRGAGLLQVTGRASHKQVADRLNLPLVMVPDFLRTRPGAALGGALWWRDHHMNVLADSGSDADVRQRINGGGLGLAEVRLATAKAFDAISLVVLA